MKRTPTTQGALIALSVGLSACAHTPTAGALPVASAPQQFQGGKTAQAGAPTDLDGAIRQAQAQRQSADLAGAIRTLSQLVLIAPDDARVLGEYGKTLVAQGRTDDAIAFLTRAIELQPNDWALYSAQGVAYDQKADYRSAQVSYDRALALKPDEASVLSNAGLSHMQSGDLAGAERLLLAAEKSGGENTRIANNLALVRDLRASKAAALEPPASVPVTSPPGTVAQTPQPSAVADAHAPDAVPAPAITPAIAPTAPEQAPAAKPETSSKPSLSGIAALAADPTVVMAPVPKETLPAKHEKTKKTTDGVTELRKDPAQKLAAEAARETLTRLAPPQ